METLPYPFPKPPLCQHLLADQIHRGNGAVIANERLILDPQSVKLLLLAACPCTEIPAQELQRGIATGKGWSAVYR